MYPRFVSIAIVFLILVGAGLILWLTLQPKEEVPQAAPSATGSRKCVADTGPYHSIETCYPSETSLKRSAGEMADREAVLTLRGFTEHEAELFKKDYVETLADEDIEVIGLGGERIYTLEVDYEMYESSASVSYVYHGYVDTLGAHPNVYFRTFTFDMQTGQELLLGDLCVGTDYLSVLSKSSRELLRAALGENASEETLLAGTTPDAQNFQNFYLENGDLVIVFAPYQVGPWSIGTQEVHIPRIDSEAMLKAEYR
ncbi:RsiV family protein [Candidatus Parcubacteria bacterium]|nr:RsiV family protein [Candidatus Parcubacteria bacterium]